MPLIESSSDKARSENIATEVHAGKPVKQAVAIGYAMQRKMESMGHPQAPKVEIKETKSE